MDLSCILFGLLFLAAGLLFAMGRLHIHLTAWKTMPPEERKRIRIRPLTRNIGAVIALCGGLFLLRGLVPAFAGRAFLLAMVGWLIVAGLDVWYISKSGRYWESQ